MSRRRLLILSCVVLVGIAGVLFYLAIANESSPEDKRWYIGGSIVLGAAALIVGTRCIRRRSPDELKTADDPNVVVHLALSGFEARAIALLLLVMAVGFGFMALSGAADQRFEVSGWIGMVCCVAASCLILATKRPAFLHLSPEGLDFSGFGVGRIPWRDIQAARYVSFSRIPMIALDLHNEDRYLSLRRELHPSFLARLFLSPPFKFASPAVDVSCDELVKAIENRISAFGRGAPTHLILEQANP